MADPVSLKIVKDFPPNIDAIRKKFNVDGRPVLFAWGDTIFNPKGVMIPPPLIRHEITHSIQQQEAGGVEGWWDRYLNDPQFRLSQEIPAHQNEFLAHLQDKPNRQQRRRLIALIAKRLSGPLYGNLISGNEARLLLDLHRINDNH